MMRVVTRRTAWAVFAGVAALAAGAGCRERADEALPKPEPFIALERDFQGYAEWTPIELAARPAQGKAHVAGETREYINALPPAGSVSFPVGTIVVKTVTGAGDSVTGAAGSETKAASSPRRDVFAMVKRGGGYNRAGSSGWEWFELRPRADGTLAIVWRGINPPSGEGYGGEAVGGCNGCHLQAAHNDYVQTPSLALSKI
jgi:hypothetical protein